MALDDKNLESSLPLDGSVVSNQPEDFVQYAQAAVTANGAQNDQPGVTIVQSGEDVSDVITVPTGEAPPAETGVTIVQSGEDEPGVVTVPAGETPPAETGVIRSSLEINDATDVEPTQPENALAEDGGNTDQIIDEAASPTDASAKMMHLWKKIHLPI